MNNYSFAPCGGCNGTTYRTVYVSKYNDFKAGDGDCKRCKGKGIYEKGFSYEENPCRRCSGSGICQGCNGSGVETNHKSILKAEHSAGIDASVYEAMKEYEIARARRSEIEATGYDAQLALLDKKVKELKILLKLKATGE